MPSPILLKNNCAVHSSAREVSRCESLLAEIDTDKNGSIDREEFVGEWLGAMCHARA